MDGDKIIALLAMTMKEKDRLDGDTAVVTVMSNLGFIKYMESQASTPKRPLWATAMCWRTCARTATPSAVSRAAM